MLQCFQVLISLMHIQHFTNILISNLKTLNAKKVTFVFVVTMQSRLPVFRARFVETRRCLCAYKLFIHPRFSILYRVPPYRITSLHFGKTCFANDILKVLVSGSNYCELQLYKSFAFVQHHVCSHICFY